MLEVKVVLVNVSLRTVSSPPGEKDPGVVEVWTILSANVSFGWLVIRVRWVEVSKEPK